MSLADFEKEIADNKEKSNDFYKFHEGSNKMQILTDFVRVESINRGGKYGGIVGGNNKPTAQDIDDSNVQVKGWAWAIIRPWIEKRQIKGAPVGTFEDIQHPQELKIVQFGKTILGQLVAFRANEEYQFKDFPMPYNIDIQAKGAGTKEVVYTVVPARQNTDITVEELDALNKESTIAQVVKAIIDKQDGNPSRNMVASSISQIPYPKDEVNTDDIPF